VIAVLDSGPLYAAVDRSDKNHRRAVEALNAPATRFLVPALVVAEVTYLIERRLGSRVEAAFLAGLSELDVLSPVPDEWARIAELVEQYSNFPLGGTDASVIVLAERLATDRIVTFDVRHFSAVRPRHCSTFRLLPA
jgi:uncharacterized protein